MVLANKFTGMYFKPIYRTARHVSKGMMEFRILYLHSDTEHFLNIKCSKVNFKVIRNVRLINNLLNLFMVNTFFICDYF